MIFYDTDISYNYMYDLTWILFSFDYIFFVCVYICVLKKWAAKIHYMTKPLGEGPEWAINIEIERKKFEFELEEIVDVI